jgi:tripartite-type tricarboxylate transporter receptor subunit TctC
MSDSASLRFGKVIAAAILVASVATTPSLSQTYPSSPVRVIVPYGAGGATDVLARVFADYLHRRLGQPFTIENRSGGGGQIGATVAARAPADGSTLFFTSPAPITIAPMISGKEARLDLTPIAIVAVQPAWLVASAASPFKTFDDVVRSSKAKADGLAFGSPGVGTESHLIAEAAARSAGMKLVHVPFRSGSEVIPALLGRQIDLASLTTATVAGPAKDGSLRVFAGSSPKRSTEFPDVPTYAELGHPGATMVPWWGLMAPPNTPATIVERLANELRAATKEPAVQERLKATFVQIEFVGPAEFAQRLKAEVTLYGDIIRAANLKAAP